MAIKLIETKWGLFSDIFIKFHRLPFGTELRLFDATNKKKRADFLVKRKAINSKTMGRVDDSDTVRFLLDMVFDVVSTDIKARKLKLKIFGPDSKEINGNTLIRTLRQKDSKPTKDDIERMQYGENLILEVQSNANGAIIESEYLIDDPSTTVCTAYVRALVERYGRVAVIEALGK